MTCDAEVVKRQVEALVERLESVKASRPWEFDLQHSLVLVGGSGPVHGGTVCIASCQLGDRYCNEHCFK